MYSKYERFPLKWPNTGRITLGYSSLERELKNVARDAQRYLQKGTSTGKSENSVWICSIFFRIMWVKFQVGFNTFYGFKIQAIIRWPTYGTGTPTVYTVMWSMNGPHVDLLHLVCIWGWYFLAAHTHVLCMGSGSATGFFPAPRLVHSLLKYFFKFQLWY